MQGVKAAMAAQRSTTILRPASAGSVAAAAPSYAPVQSAAAEGKGRVALVLTGWTHAHLTEDLMASEMC